MFVIFFISALAETNRPPFDLPEAESELVAGFRSNIPRRLTCSSCSANTWPIMLMCAIGTILFLGGWLPPIAVRAFTWVPGVDLVHG